jgi:hypothetical protein
MILAATKMYIPNGESHPWRVLVRNGKGQELPMLPYKTEVGADAGLARLQARQATPFRIDRVVLDEQGAVVSDTRVAAPAAAAEAAQGRGTYG